MGTERDKVIESERGTKKDREWETEINIVFNQD